VWGAKLSAGGARHSSSRIVAAMRLRAEEPYELIVQVRVCGGSGRVTVASTRKTEFTRRKLLLNRLMLALHLETKEFSNLDISINSDIMYS
jgi:hypothetical protein